MLTHPPPDDELAALRVEIDRIDAAMHGLLIERGGIIERLIAIKARQGGGSAFRPGREAEMMRRLAERHRGPLPLDTVESIWRVIISTFTHLQAPYAVHVAGPGLEAAMQDSARFHFGFTVPLSRHAGEADVLAAVQGSAGDLGLLPVRGAASGQTPWWAALAAPGAPRVIARLPFIERGDHPAGLPVFVLARPGVAVASRDVALLCLGGRDAELDEAEGLVARGPGVALVAVPHPEPDVAARWMANHPDLTITEIGSHAARYTFDPPAA